MAKAHSTLKTTITKTRTVKPRSRRSLTVGYSPNGGQPNPRPQLTIKGFWLGAFGVTRSASHHRCAAGVVDYQEQDIGIDAKVRSPLVKAGINTYSTGANETAISSTISK